MMVTTLPMCKLWLMHSFDPHIRAILLIALFLRTDSVAEDLRLILVEIEQEA